MTAHPFQFRFADTVQYWHPSWLFTLAFFRTVSTLLWQKITCAWRWPWRPARAFGACGPCAFHATGNLDSPHRVFEFCIPVVVSMDVVVSFSSRTGLSQTAVSLFFVIVVHVVGNLNIFKVPTRRLQRVRLFLCTCTCLGFQANIVEEFALLLFLCKSSSV